MELSKEQKLKFWSKVDIQRHDVDACWNWTAGTCRGYGLIMVNKKHYRANRIAWALANGRMPKDNMDICHRCDNPSCCNPNHLWEGTRSENLKDAYDKGRLGYYDRRNSTMRFKTDTKLTQLELLTS